MGANLNLQKVSIEQFNADLLREAARQGRLYLATAEVSEEQRQADILRYVSRIDSYAAMSDDEEQNKKNIRRLWQAIVTHPALAGHWHIRRGQRKGEVNYSFVTSVVDYLRDRGVYRADYTTHLHFRLEGVTRKTAVYNNMAQYPVSRTQRKAIDELIDSFGWVREPLPPQNFPKPMGKHQKSGV